jgi:hypothetical protein
MQAQAKPKKPVYRDIFSVTNDDTRGYHELDSICASMSCLINECEGWNIYPDVESSLSDLLADLEAHRDALDEEASREQYEEEASLNSWVDGRPTYYYGPSSPGGLLW